MREQVLFVDDDKSLLDGLRRMLRSMRDSWDMTFASSPGEALEKMRSQCFDVIVSDMRMPTMSGAELLREVKTICPRSVRIILSGQADLDLITTAIGSTHQYLAKPCDSEFLKKVVDRACGSRDILPSDDLKELVSQITVLHCQSTHLERLKAELKSAVPSIATISEIVATDVGLATQVLQLVNSAFFGTPRMIASVYSAVDVLGVDLLRSLTNAGTFVSPPNETIAVAELVRAVNNHSIEVANFSKRIATIEKVSNKEHDIYYTAGLLHDVGRLIFLTSFPEQYSQMIKTLESTDARFCEIERGFFGAAHPEVGSYLLALWGLPPALEKAALTHHNPSSTQFDIATAVYAADYLAYHLAGDPQAKEVDMGHLIKLGLEERLETWQKS